MHDDVVLLRGGCLCCGVRQDLARTLRDLHLRALQQSLPPFARVVVETTGLADPGSVVATIAAHPLVCDAYALRSVTTLVDAEHGERQLAAQDVARRQVAAADRLLISKSDRVSGPRWQHCSGACGASSHRRAGVQPVRRRRSGAVVRPIGSAPARPRVCPNEGKSIWTAFARMS